MTIEPVRRRRRRRHGLRTALGVAGLILAACALAAGAALLWWPDLRVEPDSEALAHLAGPGFAGDVSSVVVRRPDGRRVPVAVRQGRLWPAKRLRVGEQLTVELTVRRPGWAGWLVGRTATARLVVRTPEARLRGRWLELDSGDPVVARFDTPVRAVVLRAHGQARTLRFARARTAVDVGVAATGKDRAGSVSVSPVPRAWEQTPPPTRLSWFPARPVSAGGRRARRRRGARSRPPDHAHLLPSGAHDLRSEPADDHPVHARPLAPARHPHALVRAPRARVPAERSRRRPSPGACRAPAGRRPLEHPDARVGRASRDDPAARAAAGAGGLSPARVEPGCGSGDAERPPRARRHRRPAGGAVPLALREHAARAARALEDRGVELRSSAAR